MALSEILLGGLVDLHSLKAARWALEIALVKGRELLGTQLSAHIEVCLLHLDVRLAMVYILPLVLVRDVTLLRV